MAASTAIVSASAVGSDDQGARAPWYESSLQAADIDLSLRDDLTASVQDYLMRIAEELHQLSRWSRRCESRLSVLEEHSARLEERERREKERQQSPMQQATLLLQTELELLRRDVQAASQDVFQRATTQMAYVQNSFRSEHADQIAETQRRFDDKLRFFTQRTVAMIETAQQDALAKITCVETALLKLQQEVERERGRLLRLEQSVSDALPQLQAVQHKHQQELAHTQRHVENVEASQARQLADVKTATHEAIQAVRNTQTQLSSKFQVLRIEMQEQNEDLARKFLQLNRFQSRVGGTGSFEASSLTVVPKSPQRTGGSSTPVRMSVGASSIAKASGGDCFLHASAALPPRSPVEPRPLMSPLPASAPATRQRITGKTDVVGGDNQDSLSIQQSTLSPPVGREDGGGGISSSPRKPSVRSQWASAPGTTAHRPPIPRPDSAKG